MPACVSLPDFKHTLTDFPQAFNKQRMDVLFAWQCVLEIPADIFDMPVYESLGHWKNGKRRHRWNTR